MTSTGNINSVSGVWRRIHPWDLWDEHMKHADRSQIGIFLSGYAGIVLGGVDAVDGSVDVVRKPGRLSGSGIMGTILVHAGVVSRVNECSTQDKVMVEDDLKVVPFDLVAYKTPYDVRMFREYIWGMV